VQPGEYLIFAGTDSDGDAVICDAGEACGAFPTTDSVEAITIDSDRGDLRFVTGFETDVGAAAASAGASAERRGYSTRLGGTPPQ
jgi:serine protease